VALSRARLGLYVFGRFELFSECHELRNAFKMFLGKSLKLNLVLGETYPTKRKSGVLEKKQTEKEVEGFQDLYKIVQDLLKQRA